MRTFKFFTNNIPRVPIGRWSSVGNTGIVRYDNGCEIIRYSQTLIAKCNQIFHGQHDSFSFRWGRNYDHINILGEQYSDNLTEEYEGTIGRFYETYQHRRRITTNAIIPIIPVISKIECYNCGFFIDSLKFNNNDMWVNILYKKFYETN